MPEKIKRFGVYFTPSQHKLISKTAKKLGLSRSATIWKLVNPKTLKDLEYKYED